MNWNEILIIAASVLVLGASLFFVWKGRRRELEADRATAVALDRIAGTVDELHRTVAATRPVEAEANYRDLPVTNVRVIRFAGSDSTVPQPAKLRVHAGPLSAVSPAGNVVNLWEHITREAGDDDSYRSVLGPVFDDAVYHAASAGVMDREQAEALVFWADSTAALARPARAKSGLYSQAVSGDTSLSRVEARV